MHRILVLALGIFLSIGITANGAVYVVTKTADTNDGVCDEDCSLREAIAAANASPDDDEIVFDPGFFNVPRTIVLAGSEMVITNSGSLRISGPGASKLTLDGNLQSRIISISPGAVVFLDAMTFTRGTGAGATNNNSGGAIMNNAGFVTLTNSVVTGNQTTGTAGGIRNSGTASTFTIINCVISNNSAGSSAGGIQNFNTSFLTVSNTSFIGNSANGGTVGGGAIQANGQVRITNSTFSGNSTTSAGGGISSNGTLLLLTNVTMSGNSAVTQGGGLHRGTTNVNGYLRNTIIAGNDGIGTSPDVTNSANGLASQGSNLIGNVGTSTGWEASDQLNVNPILGPLAFNGGLGMTHALLAGSPALDNGDDCVLTLTCKANNPLEPVAIDQRGQPRAAVGPLGGSAVDIGAYEDNAVTPAFLNNAELNTEYTYTLMPNATGFVVTAPVPADLPPGLAVVAVGNEIRLTGIPVAVGNYEFDVITASATAPMEATSHRYFLNVSSDPNEIYFAGKATRNGRIPNQRYRMSLTGLNGRTMSANTSSFGYFRINRVVPGSLYVFSVRGREFGTLSITAVLNGTVEIEDFDLGLGGGPFRADTKWPLEKR